MIWRIGIHVMCHGLRWRVYERLSLYPITSNLTLYSSSIYNCIMLNHYTTKYRPTVRCLHCIIICLICRNARYWFDCKFDWLQIYYEEKFKIKRLPSNFWIFSQLNKVGTPSIKIILWPSTNKLVCFLTTIKIWIREKENNI